MQFRDMVTISSASLSQKMYYQDILILTYTITYPVFSSQKYQNTVNRMNAYYNEKALTFARYIHTTLFQSAVADYRNSIKNGYPVHEYEAMLDFTVTYNEDCTVSLYMDQYEYTGGAHGNTTRSSDTWLLTTGTRIPLKALFPRDSGYISHLKGEIDRQITEQMDRGNHNYFENYTELVEKTFDPQNFYLMPDALTIYFQQYDIAPYVTGIPTFSIAYDKTAIRLPHCP